MKHKKQWKSIVLFFDNDNEKEQIKEQLMKILKKTKVKKFNFNYYNDHISFRVYCLEPSLMKLYQEFIWVKKEIHSYEEKFVVREGYLIGTSLYLHFIKHFKRVDNMEPNEHHMIHGFLDNLGYEYWEEVKLYYKLLITIFLSMLHNDYKIPLWILKPIKWVLLLGKK